MLKELIISMRPRQWYKNLVLFIGIIFSLNMFNFQMWIIVISAFIIFCMLSGSEYIINDIIDFEKDKNHPKKSKRPIASQKLKKIPALLFAILLIITAILWSYLINIQFFAISITYFILILLYSLIFKNLIIIDLIVISLGFVIRAIAGALVINLLISPWLIICAFLLAFFLALGKRKQELSLLKDEAKEHREVFKDYSSKMLNQMILIIISVLIISYSMYTFIINNIYMMLTIPFVIYGLFRYLYLINTTDFGGEPEMLFKDKGMLICIILWVILIVAVLYGIPNIIIQLVFKG